MSPQSAPSLSVIARSLVIALACISFLAACPTTSSKNKEHQGPGARLIGTWEQTTDDELRRLSTVPPTMTYNEDGTYVLAMTAMGQDVRQELRWKLVEDTPEMIHVTVEEQDSRPAGESRIYFVDRDTIKIGVAQSTKQFIFWRRVK